MLQANARNCFRKNLLLVYVCAVCVLAVVFAERMQTDLDGGALRACVCVCVFVRACVGGWDWSSYIMDPVVRRAMGIDIDQGVVIFDEVRQPSDKCLLSIAYYPSLVGNGEQQSLPCPADSNPGVMCQRQQRGTTCMKGQAGSDMRCDFVAIRWINQFTG